MKKLHDLYPLLGAVKKAVTKNFWLKIVSLVLALATYTALEPKAEVRSNTGSAEQNDNRQLSDMLKLLKRDGQDDTKSTSETTNGLSSASSTGKKK